MLYRAFFLFFIVLLSSIFISFHPGDLKKRITTLSDFPGQYNIFNINNLQQWVKSDGSSSQNPFGGSGTFYPAGTAGVVFFDGLLWGGYIHNPNPDLPHYRFGGQQYKVSTVGGRIISPGVAQDPQDESVRVYRIRKDWQQLKADDPQLIAEAKMWLDMGAFADTLELVNQIIAQYQKDWLEWPVEYGAPFYDLNGNSRYEPDLGETPGLAGADQVLWLVVNDLDERYTRTLFDCPPMGLEIQQTSWGYDQPGLPLGQAAFHRYRIINKSGFKIDSMYVGPFVDPDIGDYTNDLIGCDTLLQMGFAYNGYTRDDQFDEFDLFPSAVGHQLLQGPIIPNVGKSALFDFELKPDFRNLPLKAFTYLGPGCSTCDPDLGSYSHGVKMYHLLQGFLPDGDLEIMDPFVVQTGPEKGKETKFPLSGDPLTMYGDLAGVYPNIGPVDFRTVMGSGPFTMQPGDTQEVVYALIGGAGSAHHPFSVQALKLNALYIKIFYPNFSGLIDSVASPRVSGMSSEGQMILEWGSDPGLTGIIERDNPASRYQFEGYNIYQLPSVDATDDQAILIESIDKKGNPATVFGYKKDSQTGIYSYQPLVFGSNKGIRYYTSIDRDHINNESFQAAQKYTFAVSAYRYQPTPGNPFPIIESVLSRVTIEAHTIDPGYSAQVGQKIEAEHYGFSSGKVTAIVVNPADLTGHDYQVNFTNDQGWLLTDLTTGEVKLSAQTNLSGDQNYPVVDGFIPIVYGPVESGKIKIDNFYNVQGIKEVDWGGQSYRGGIGWGSSFFGSTIVQDSLVPVRIELQEGFQVQPEGFVSKGAAYLNDEEKSFNGIGNLPVTAYDILNPDSSRRLNICFCENTESANLIWDLGWNGQTFPDDVGANEYLLIMNSDYNEGADYNGQINGTKADVLYALWISAIQINESSRPSGSFDIEVQLRNMPHDRFVFKVPQAPNLPQKLDLHPAYPNPFNSQVRIPFQVPRFGRVKIDIYDLSGQHVAKIMDMVLEQGTHQTLWDPGNLSSGMYFIRISSGRVQAVRKILYLK